MATRTSDWMARSARRKDLELSMHKVRTQFQIQEEEEEEAENEAQLLPAATNRKSTSNFSRKTRPRRAHTQEATAMVAGDQRSSTSCTSSPISIQKRSESMYYSSSTTTRSFSVHSSASGGTTHASVGGGNHHPSFIPSSPSGSVASTAPSSLSNHPEGGEDQLQSLIKKLRANTAEMDANEAQMRALNAVDQQVSCGIEERLQAVQSLNDRLMDLNRLMARVEEVSRGNF